MIRRRIVIVASWYPSERAPTAGVFVRDQALALAERHDVAVVALAYRGWRTTAQYGLGPRVAVEWDRNMKVVRPRVVGLVPRSQWAASRAHAAALALALNVLRRDWGVPDILHAHVVLPAGRAALTVGHRLEIPVVLTEHSGPFSMHLGGLAGPRLVRQTLKGVNRAIAVSPGLRDQMTSVEPSVSPTVIGNVVDVDAFAMIPRPSPRDQRALHLFSIGGLVPQKGYLDLLEAIAVLRRRGVAVELHIAGEGPMKTELTERIRTEGLGSNVRLLGGLAREAIAAEFAWSDAFVSSSYHETFGVAIVEALASGRPVVATSTDGAKFVLEDVGGTTSEPGDAGGLAEALLDLTRGQWTLGRQETLRASARRRFSPDVIAAQISRVYEEVLAGHSAGGDRP